MDDLDGIWRDRGLSLSNSEVGFEAIALCVDHGLILNEDNEITRKESPNI